MDSKSIDDERSAPRTETALDQARAQLAARCSDVEFTTVEHTHDKPTREVRDGG